MVAYNPAYKKLLVYQRTHALVLRIYSITKSYPKDEQFALISQMRRAAVSVPANLIEGWARQTVKEKRNFYHIARGSLAELIYYLDLSRDLKYAAEKDLSDIEQLAFETARLLQGLINKFVIP
ncbi:MAG: four helix bundle protein [Patescibacteria group bacterium]